MVAGQQPKGSGEPPGRKGTVGRQQGDGLPAAREEKPAKRKVKSGAKGGWG